MAGRAVIYCRISEDALGEGLGVQRQEEDCRALAVSNGYEVVGVYTDNDITAAGAVKKERPQWDQMLADAQSDAFDTVLAYSNSRLTRRLVELETLIQLHDKHGITFRTVVSGQDDLATADGRMVARIKASVDAAEAERVGERVARAARQRAEKGIPQKGRYRLFGYTRDWSVDVEESKVVKEAFERRASGESTTSICTDFTKRGIKTVQGKDWKSGTLSVTLTKPIYCGLREYKGQIIGPSAVPALVDKDLFNAAQKNLANDKKGTNARKYLLSGILQCSQCLSPFKGNPANQMYRCSTTYGGCGRLSVRIAPSDEYVFHAAMSRYAMRVGNAKEGGTPRDFTAAIATISDEIKRLQEGFAAGLFELAEVNPLVKEKRLLLRDLERQAALQRPSMPKIQRKYFDWHKMNLSQRRAFIGEHITSIVVYPALPQGARGFDPARLECHYPDGTKERLERYVDYDERDDAPEP